MNNMALENEECSRLRNYMIQGPEVKESMAWEVGSTYVWVGLADISTRRRAMGVPVEF